MSVHLPYSSATLMTRDTLTALNCQGTSQSDVTDTVLSMFSWNDWPWECVVCGQLVTLPWGAGRVRRHGAARPWQHKVSRPCSEALAGRIGYYSYKMTILNS